MTSTAGFGNLFLEKELPTPAGTTRLEQEQTMSKSHEAPKKIKKKPKLTMKEKRALKKARKHPQDMGGEIHAAVE